MAHVHSHEHSHGDSHGATARIVLSSVLLVTGMVLNHLHQDWFMRPAINLAWFLAAFLPVGLPVVREAIESVRAKDYFNEFMLMVTACAGAFAIGEYPEAVAVMLFYTIGETLQHRSVEKAVGDIGRLLDVRPEKTRVLRDGSQRLIPPAEVTVGESIDVLPGERVALDGELLNGHGLFDTSALTGESLPRDVERGGEVLAGMIVCGSPVRVRVTKPYGQSALARILEMVEDASERKAPTEMFIRRFARVYTPLVMLLALLIVVVPALVGQFSASFHYVLSEWLYRGLVFLVISCPCALVISVPLSYFAGIGAASRAGILFKGGTCLEAMAHINTVAFDKTGTLTTGRFEVTKTIAGTLPEAELYGILLSAERISNHPIAQAVVRYVQSKGAVRARLTEICEIPGRGVSAMSEGKQILVGNATLLAENGLHVPATLADCSGTVVVCTCDGDFAGALVLEDTLKPDAEEAVRRLRSSGIGIFILSGDRRETVADCGRRLGVDKAFGELLPDMKARMVGDWVAGGRKTAFVGDGMNDAPVLALSTVGIAMGGLGADAAVESADVVIQNDMPLKVATARDIALYTRKIVNENIVGTIGFKVIILVAGAFGYVSMWAAVFADVGVALLAVLNSLRILRHGRHE